MVGRKEIADLVRNLRKELGNRSVRILKRVTIHNGKVVRELVHLKDSIQYDLEGNARLNWNDPNGSTRSTLIEGKGGSHGREMGMRSV